MAASRTGATHSAGVGFAGPAARAVCFPRTGYWPCTTSAASRFTSSALEPKWYEIAEGFLIPAAARISRVEVAVIPCRPMSCSAVSYKRSRAPPSAMPHHATWETRASKNATLALTKDTAYRDDAVEGTRGTPPRLLFESANQESGVTGFAPIR